MQSTHSTRTPAMTLGAALARVFTDIGQALQTADASARRSYKRKPGMLKRKVVSGNKAVMPREPAARKNAARKASKVARKSRVKNKAK